MGQTLVVIPCEDRGRRLPGMLFPTYLWNLSNLSKRNTPLTFLFYRRGTHFSLRVFAFGSPCIAPGSRGKNRHLSFGLPRLTPGSIGGGHHPLRVFAFGSPRLTPGSIGRNPLSFGPPCLAPGSNGEGHLPIRSLPLVHRASRRVP